MQRIALDADWGPEFSMLQGEVVEGATRVLRCSGQVALTPDAEAPLGLAVEAPGDMRGQIGIALARIDNLLGQAGMDRSSIVFVHFFTTDMERFLAHYDAYGDWIAESGELPPQSLLGVAALAVPGLLVEIEITAAS